MKLSLLLAILICGAVLVAYCWIEKRVGQQACLECGSRVSADTIDEQCPRCGQAI